MARCAIALAPQEDNYVRNGESTFMKSIGVTSAHRSCTNYCPAAEVVEIWLRRGPAGHFEAQLDPKEVNADDQGEPMKIMM
jgi:hypothetical protein